MSCFLEVRVIDQHFYSTLYQETYLPKLHSTIVPNHSITYWDSNYVQNRRVAKEGYSYRTSGSAKIILNGNGGMFPINSQPATKRYSHFSCNSKALFSNLSISAQLYILLK